MDSSKKMSKDELLKYLANDLTIISDEISRKGILYESQFPKLYSMFCKHNSSELVELLSEDTGLEISHGYDNINCIFVYYDENRFNRSTAINESKRVAGGQGY